MTRQLIRFVCCRCSATARSRRKSFRAPGVSARPSNHCRSSLGWQQQVLACTLIKKKKKIFLIYSEIQSGAVAKSYMTNGLLIYDLIFSHFLIYKKALPHIWLCNRSTQNFTIFKEILFYFLSVYALASTVSYRVYFPLPAISVPFRSSCSWQHRVHTEWQRLVSGVHSIMMESSALAGEGGGARHKPPFTLLLLQTKLQCTFQLRRQIHSPYFISTLICTYYSYSVSSLYSK